MVYSKNDYLTQSEMTTNAQYIMNDLLQKGWTKNSIAGMLGNMETESTINPGIWQGLNEGNMSGGFGLVQWTPASKYTDWADTNGYNWDDIVGQLIRLQYEIDNNLQWIATTDYPISFQEFKTSTETPEYLGQAFLLNYERPANQDQPERSTQSRYWFDNLSGGSDNPLFPTTEGLTITSGYGLRYHPIYEEYRFHYGIDIGGGGVNHPIYATQTGVISYNQSTSFGGWTVRVQHSGEDYHSQYQHLMEQSPLAIGTPVSKGDIIGTMGTTGDSTGIHLDFSIATSASGFFTQDGTIDPEIYLENSVSNPDPDPEQPINQQDIHTIHLLLCGALNGW